MTHAPAVDLQGAGREMGAPGACIEWAQRLAAETILSRAGRLERQLYLWGGRDSQGRAPEFYNDLWEYDPDGGAWTCIQENRADDVARPPPGTGWDTL